MTTANARSPFRHGGRPRRLTPVTVGMRIAAHPPRRSGRGRWTIRLLPRVLDGEPLVRPWVTDGYARPQDVGHAHQAPPAEAGSLGPPAQRAHPQASQPAREGTDEPMRPWDGKVVEPAVTDPPEPPADFPDIVVPALAEHLADARQGPADPFGDRFATQPEASSPGRRAIVRVKPRKSNVSGLPTPRWRRFSNANRPNSTRRVLSGCRLRPNRASLSRTSRRYRSASRLCWNPTTISSA